jgi:hypothetical protein
MKKYLLFSFSVCLLVSCASQPPKWYTNPKVSDSIFYGAGQVDVGESDNIKTGNAAQTAATDRARTDLLKQLTAAVDAMSVDYTGGGTAYFETISRTLSSDVLKNSKVVNRTVAGNTHYIQVSYTKEQMYDTVKKASEEARINANEALKAMDNALNKMR